MGSIFSKDATPKTSVVTPNAGGLTFDFAKKKKSITASSSAERKGLVGQIAETFPEQAALLGDLRSMVAPGVSKLRESRLAGLAGSRQRAIGNLRENLSRRKVLGSSFAQDALTRAELEFQQEGDRIEAESLLTELDMTNKLAAQEFQAKRAEFETFLGEMNLQLQVATQIASQATAEFNANARLGAELNAAASAGLGSFVGKVAGIAGAPFTGGASLALSLPQGGSLSLGGGG